MKLCVKCSTEKELSEFPSKGAVCKPCKRLIDKLYRDTNKESIAKANKSWRERNQEAVKSARIERASFRKERKLANKIAIRELAGGCCKVCGYNKCGDALEFHHIDPTKKLFRISAAVSESITPRLLEEINKCILLCSNCHREYHAGLIQLELHA